MRNFSIWIIRLTLFGAAVAAAWLDRHDLAGTMTISLLCSFWFLSTKEEES